MFTSTSLDSKKNPLLSIKVNLTLDGIDFLLYDNTHRQKCREDYSPLSSDVSDRGILYLCWLLHSSLCLSGLHACSGP